MAFLSQTSVLLDGIRRERKGIIISIPFLAILAPLREIQNKHTSFHQKRHPGKQKKAQRLSVPPCLSASVRGKKENQPKPTQQISKQIQISKTNHLCAPVSPVRG